MITSMDSTQSVRAFRDTFGDPKPPDITRKITACVACRKQKIKCHMRNSQPPCSRCSSRGLPCVVNRSLQMILENDTIWKDAMERRMRKLEDTMMRMSSNQTAFERAHTARQPIPIAEPSAASTERAFVTQLQAVSVEGPTHEAQPSDHCEVVMDLDSDPGAIPGFSIATSPETRASGWNGKDIISQGTISLENAERYFDTYQNRLDHFPYRILGNHSSSSLKDVREASPLLVTAVCTVGALHLASNDFKACYRDFVSISAARSYSKRCTIDDIRALCIGAFWLSDLSWTLVSAAVRMATEMQLHKSIFKALQGDQAHYYRARLYFLVYACDHHFSIAFGRPPLTRECEAIRNAREFLKCQYATGDDARLVSQVLRWSVCSNIYDAFDVDFGMPLPDSKISQFRKFSAALDNLRDEWTNSFPPSNHVGNYPRKGVRLQYHFAKLYLCSHAFRGGKIGDSQNRSEDVVMELDEIAHSAVTAAISIVRNVVSDPEIHSFLDGLPIYFDTMIAFAVVFLVKITTNKYSISIRPDVEEVQQLLATLSTTLNQVCSKMHPQHLLVSITKGIDGLLQRCASTACGSNMPPTNLAAQGQQDQSTMDISLRNDPVDWMMGGSSDLYFMGEYDFLLNQDMGPDLNFGYHNG